MASAGTAAAVGFGLGVLATSAFWWTVPGSCRGPIDRDRADAGPGAVVAARPVVDPGPVVPVSNPAARQQERVQAAERTDPPQPDGALAAQSVPSPTQRALLVELAHEGIVADAVLDYGRRAEWKALAEEWQQRTSSIRSATGKMNLAAMAVSQSLLAQGRCEHYQGVEWTSDDAPWPPARADEILTITTGFDPQLQMPETRIVRLVPGTSFEVDRLRSEVEDLKRERQRVIAARLARVRVK